jgi:hypothetical protein
MIYKLEKNKIKIILDDKNAMESRLKDGFKLVETIKDKPKKK